MIDLCWLGAVLRNLPGSIVLTVGFWVLGGNFVLYWGTKKNYSSSLCVAGGDRCSSYYGQAFVPVLFWMRAALHLYVLRFACGFTFESVLITQIMILA